MMSILDLNSILFAAVGAIVFSLVIAPGTSILATSNGTNQITVESIGESEYSPMPEVFTEELITNVSNFTEQMPEPLEVPANDIGESSEISAINETATAIINLSSSSFGRQPAPSGSEDFLIQESTSQPTSFEGLTQKQSGNPPITKLKTPPDPALAAGKEQIVEMVNTAGLATNRDGSNNIAFDLYSHFRAIGHELSDPIVAYDSGTGRFFATILDISDGAVRITTSEPNDPDPTRWKVSKINFSRDGKACPDQPYMAITADKLLIGANVWGNHCKKDSAGNSPPYLGSRHVIIDKSDLISGTKNLKSFASSLDQTTSSDRPAKTSGQTNKMIFASLNRERNGIKVTEYTGPIENLQKTVTPIPIRPIMEPPVADQPRTTTKIDTDDRLQSVVLSNDGKVLWLGSMQSCNGDTCLRIIAVNTEAKKILYDLDIKSPGLDLIYPSIAVTAKGDAVISFGASSTSLFPSIFRTGKVLGSQPDEVLDPKLILSGREPYTPCDYQKIVSNKKVCVGRFGDYFGSSVDPDPSDMSSAWMIGQTIKGGEWATFITKENVS